MESKCIATPSRTNEVLRTHHLSSKKSLGQNFVVDVNVLEKMIRDSGIEEDDGAIEVGPGIGALTEQLAIHADKVLAYEIDQRFLPVLDDTLKHYDNVKVVHEDILQANIQEDIQAYFDKGQAIHILGNLPYYITTPILMKLIHDKLHVDRITVLIQKEVADRIAAGPNTKDYGSLSIAIQYYMVPKRKMLVPKTVFMPQPNVDSSVLQLTKRKEAPVSVHDEDYFFTFVRACFRQRRKTLRNNLNAFYADILSKNSIKQTLDQAGIDPSRRAETLSMEEFAELSNTFHEVGKA